jgi:hypothetical protein
MAVDNEPQLADESVREYVNSIVEEGVRAQGRTLSTVQEMGGIVIMRAGSWSGIHLPYDVQERLRAVMPRMINVSGIELIHAPDPTKNAHNGRVHLGYRTDLIVAGRLPPHPLSTGKRMVTTEDNPRYRVEGIPFESETIKALVNQHATPMSVGVLDGMGLKLNGLGGFEYTVKQALPIDLQDVEAIAQSFHRHAAWNVKGGKEVRIFEPKSPMVIPQR